MRCCAVHRSIDPDARIRRSRLPRTVEALSPSGLGVIDEENEAGLSLSICQPCTHDASMPPSGPDQAPVSPQQLSTRFPGALSTTPVREPIDIATQIDPADVLSLQEPQGLHADAGPDQQDADLGCPRTLPCIFCAQERCVCLDRRYTMLQDSDAETPHPRVGGDGDMPGGSSNSM